jgi:hypothetical protein
MADAVFCSAVDVLVFEKCMTMAEWSATWQSTAIIISLLVGVFTVHKILEDIAVGRAQKKYAEKLESAKFLLEQHRRLFDDKDLKDVLQHLDGDDEELAGKKYWEKNRKFLVFIEEIQLLINSGFLEERTCQYMFGYYAHCALNGDNFKEGINFDEAHWGLFVKFAKNYDIYVSEFKGEYADAIKIWK